MPCKVYEELRTLIFPAVEALEIDPCSEAYPYPPLALTGQTSEVTLPLLVIENELVKAVVAPSMGGRLMSLQDRRTGLEAIPQAGSLSLVPGGDRGIISPFGVQLSFDGSERLNAMAPVEVASSVSEVGDSAEILVANSTCWPFSFHVRYAVSQDIAGVRIEAKILNRSLQPQSYNGGLLFARESTLKKTFAGYQVSRCLVQTRELRPTPLGLVPSLLRFPRGRLSAARQLDTWTVDLLPVKAAQDPCLIGSAVEAVFAEDRIELSSNERLSNVRVWALNAKNETLEASVGLEPSNTVSLGLSSSDLPVNQLVIRNASAELLLQWPMPPTEEPDLEERLPLLSDSPSQIAYSGFTMGYRHLAHLILALQALTRKEIDQADALLEQSLLFNAEDQLAWWLKAWCVRSIDPNGKSDEILNAHYLAPLDPILKVEAFLSQVGAPDDAANPLLAQLAEDQDALLDAACLMIEAGLFQDTARLLLEAFKIKESPLLRYCLAFCFLEGSRMEMEAANHVQLAGKIGVVGPYPFRPVEHQVIQKLHEKWPRNSQLNTYFALSIESRDRKRVTSENDLE